MQRELTCMEREMASLFRMARLLQSESHLKRARTIRDCLELTGYPKGLHIVPDNKELDNFLQLQGEETICFP